MKPAKSRVSAVLPRSNDGCATGPPVAFFFYESGADHSETLKALLIEVWRLLSRISNMQKRSQSLTGKGRLIVRVSIFATALSVIMCTMSPAAEAPSQPQTHTVTIERMRFQPEVLTVAPGDTIVWVNKDPVPYTATSKAGGFDSKDIQADKSWRHTIRKKGDFAYTCTFHPTMNAMLRVK